MASSARRRAQMRRGLRPEKHLPPRAVGQRQIQQHHIMAPLAQSRQRLSQRLDMGELKLAGSALWGGFDVA